MKSRINVKALINLAPLLAIAAIGFLLWSHHQKQALSRPDYDSAEDYVYQPTGKLIGATPHRVERVSDGDTIVLDNGNKVRLCGIDAPEKDQPLGAESKQNLERLIKSAGGSVLVQENDRDRYGRIVGEVFIKTSHDEQLLNAEQVRSGLAFVYPHYVKHCINEVALTNVENDAKQRKIGVWRDPNYQRPWNYRRLKRSQQGQ